MSTTRGPSDDELGLACRRLFDRLETTLALLTVPPEVQCGIARRLRSAPTDRAGPESPRLTIAVPKLDSATQGSAAGIRASPAPSSNRQLVYAAQPAEVALSVRRRSGGPQLDLYGQVFPAGASDDARYEAVLLRGKEEAAKAPADELGEFSFEGVSPGEYYMLICCDTAEVVIVPLRMNE